MKLEKSRVITLMPVKKMSRALKFYTGSLGAKLEYRGQGEMKETWASVRFGKQSIWLVGADKPEVRRLSYTAFLVPNIRSVVKGLQAKKVKFDRPTRSGPQTKIEGPIAVEPFGASAFFKDSEGNLLMVWQNDPAM